MTTNEIILVVVVTFVSMIFYGYLYLNLAARYAHFVDAFNSLSAKNEDLRSSLADWVRSSHDSSVDSYEKLDKFRGVFAEHAVLTYNASLSIQTILQELQQSVSGRLSGINSIVDLIHANLAELRDLQRQHSLQLISHSECFVSSLGKLQEPIDSIREIVEAFKNDLSTQVRLSREDYEELMATAESKDAQLLQRLDDLQRVLPFVVALQAQLEEFRVEFREVTRT